MRLFEMILCLFLISTIVLKIKVDQKKYRILILVPLIFHFLIEGYRWQMIIIYILCILVIIIEILRFANPHKFNKRSKGKSLVFIVLTIISTMLLISFPVKNMNKPIGNFKVGTMSYDLTDFNRTEIYGDTKGEPRKIRIQLWYPTDDSTSGSKGKWIEDGAVVPNELMKIYNMPEWVMNQSTLVKSNSYENGSLNQNLDTMPVIIISHGWTGFRNLHSDLGEMFASFGFLVISIDHTYGSVGLVFDDGSKVINDPLALPERDENEAFDLYANRLVDTYAEDSRLVLNHIFDLNQGISDKNIGVSLSQEDDINMFKNKLSINQIGAIGHSTGGGGIVKLALTDNRIKAIVGYDPWVEPIGQEMLEKGFNQEAMFFRSSSWAGGINDGYIKILALNEKVPLKIFEIIGSKHQDFTMLYQFGPIPKWQGISGELDGRESAKIWQAFTLEFMKKSLLDQDSEFDSLEKQYDEVFEVNHSK